MIRLAACLAVMALAAPAAAQWPRGFSTNAIGYVVEMRFGEPVLVLVAQDVLELNWYELSGQPTVELGAGSAHILNTRACTVGSSLGWASTHNGEFHPGLPIRRVGLNSGLVGSPWLPTATGLRTATVHVGLCREVGVGRVAGPCGEPGCFEYFYGNYLAVEFRVRLR